MTNRIINIDVVIGWHSTSDKLVPKIVRAVYIEPSVKVFDDVKVRDNSILVANTVVNKDAFLWL